MDAALVGLDPLFLTNVKLFIKDILSLERVEQGQIDVYRFYGHSIKFVDICGIIVGVERKSTSTIYTVDDNTETIACMLWNESARTNHDILPLGRTVRVTGKISVFRDERHLVIYDIYPILDPNVEAQHFLQVLLYREEYKKEFELPNRIQLHKHEIVEELQKYSNEEAFISTQQLDYICSEAALKEKVLAFLKSYPAKQFLSTVARDDPDIKKMAELALTQAKEEPNGKNITKLLSKIWRELLDDGDIAPISKKSSTYTVVDDELLGNAVVQIIQDLLEETPDQYGGIRTAYIIEKVADVLPKYEHLQKTKKINKIIGELVDQNILYSSGTGEYKVMP